MDTLLNVLKDIYARRGDVELEAGPWTLPVSQIIAMVLADISKETPQGEAALEPVYFWGYTADQKISVTKIDSEFGMYRILGEAGSGGPYGPSPIIAEGRETQMFTLDDVEISFSYIPENNEYYLIFKIPSQNPEEDPHVMFIDIPKSEDPVVDHREILRNFLLNLIPLVDDPDSFQEQALTHRDEKLLKLALRLGKKRLQKMAKSPKDWIPRPKEFIRTWV